MSKDCYTQAGGNYGYMGQCAAEEKERLIQTVDYLRRRIYKERRQALKLYKENLELADAIFKLEKQLKPLINLREKLAEKLFDSSNKFQEGIYLELMNMLKVKVSDRVQTFTIDELYPDAWVSQVEAGQLYTGRLHDEEAVVAAIGRGLEWRRINGYWTREIDMLGADNAAA